MTRLHRRKRNDIWFSNYLQTKDTFNEELKRIWFINDVELGFILKDIDDLNLNMTYKPQHLTFTLKKQIIGFVNTKVLCHRKEEKYNRESIFSMVEKVQKTVFELGNSLLKIVTEQRLKYYRIEIAQLVIHIRLNIYRLKCNKLISSITIEFDNFTYSASLINDLAKEYKFQVSQKAGKDVLQEINHIASIFGIELEHHRCIEGKPIKLKKEFMAYIYIDCLDLKMNEIIESLYTGNPLPESTYEEFNHYRNVLKNNGWKLDSPVWERIIAVLLNKDTPEPKEQVSIEEYTKAIIAEMKQEKVFGVGFFIFSNFLNEYRYLPSQNNIIKMEETLRTRINYWIY